MKNNNNNLTTPVKRNRHDDGAKISMMANDIAVTRVTSEKLKMYQDKHDDMLYHTILNLMDAPNHGANDTFTVDGKLYNFTASGYEAVLKKFDTIRHKLEEAQAASEKLPAMEEAYTKLISEALGINTEDVANMDKEGDNMKEKYEYIVIETGIYCEPTKLSASEPGKLIPMPNEKHCCNCDNCNEGNKEVCQGCFDCEEGVKSLELSNNCDGNKSETPSDTSLKDTTTLPQTATHVSIPVGYPEASVPMMKSIDVPDIEALDVNTGDIGLSVTAGDMTDISGNITFNVSGDIIIDSFNGGRNNTNCK